MENIYVQVLMQWLLFFAIVSIILVPALLFRKIALRNNKKGWLFFLVGLGVGLTALQAVRLMILLLLQFDIPEQFRKYVFILLLIIGYIIVIIAVRFFRQKLNNGKSQPD